MREHHRERGLLPATTVVFRARWALLVAICGIVAALALPFAPVTATTTTVTWPQPGQPAESTTALFVPYRPADLTAELPCAVLRNAGALVTVLATGADGRGMTVTSGGTGARVSTDGHDVELSTPTAECLVTIRADRNGFTVTGGDGAVTELPEVAVPMVFAFRTDLDPRTAAGISVTVHTASPFATSPTWAKWLLIALQLSAAAGVLVLLGTRLRRVRIRPRRAWWVDGAVVAVLAGWAVIGPLAVDDGWATMIARNFASTGNPGNYYRWWNGSEVPFALSQEVLSRFTDVSLAPLWLRVPSTLLAVATWLVLSRGLLGVALPVRGRSTAVRLLAAVFLLAAWLPFNLGARPESFVALGVVTFLTLLWQARTSAGLGWAALVAGLTAAITPTALLMVGPLVVFAPRAIHVLRAGARSRLDVIARTAALGCLAAVGLTAMFADQTMTALLTATDWHAFFGPTLSFYDEPDRYAYLLGTEQQGSAAKRLPVLLAVAMLPVVGVLAWRRDGRTSIAASAVRLGAVLILGLAALSFAPSKWSYHLGGAAGLIASFLTVATVLVVSQLRDTAVRRSSVVTAVGAATLCACVCAWAFAGPNAWWLPTAYDVPWPGGPIRPGGVPLDHPLTWAALAVAGCLVLSLRGRPGRATLVAPAIVTVLAAATSVVVLLGSFVAAPVRRPEGSLAVANLDRLRGTSVCGLADDVQLLPDGAVLAKAEDDGSSAGFSAQAGYPPGATPPDPPGTGASTFLWGSYVTGPADTATVTTPWFDLPALGPDDGVAVSLAGRSVDGNEMVFEYGRARPDGVAVVGSSVPVGRTAIDEDPRHPLWRSVGVDSDQVTPGTDRVRIRATDARTDEFGWLAFTGPRLRSVIGLNQFLAGRGPVLISWPLAFLFPCVRDVPVVADGLAQTPRTVIETPRPYFAEDRAIDAGGTFAALTDFGDLQELTSRLIGHPEADWGSVFVSGTAFAPDAYQVTHDRVVVPGLSGQPRPPPER